MRMVLDMDTGVDDAIAIVLAANSPEVEVTAITTVAGNAPVRECTRNCLLLSELLWPGSPPPVARGAEGPLEQALLTAPEVHGDDGLGGATGTLPDPATRATARDAVETILDAARRADDRAALVATGPLTNVARAIERDRAALDGFDRVVVMGGAFTVPGNTGPAAEFNFYVDPEAANVVLESGLDVTIVPLDATTRYPLMRSAVAARPLAAPPPPGPLPRSLSRILARAFDYYMRFQKEESGLDGGFMHDPLAVAAALDPRIVRTAAGSVTVETSGANRGRSVMRPPRRGGRVSVAFDLDEDVFRALLADRVLDPLFGRPGP